MLRPTLLIFIAVCCGAQTITPESAILGPGATQKFAVSCAAGAPCSTEWSIDSKWCGDPPGAQLGGVDSNGVYTAPVTISTAQTVHLAATVDGAFLCGPLIALTPPPATVPDGLLLCRNGACTPLTCATLVKGDKGDPGASGPPGPPGPSGAAVSVERWLSDAPPAPGTCIRGTEAVIDAKGFAYICGPPVNQALEGGGWVWWRSPQPWTLTW